MTGPSFNWDQNNQWQQELQAALEAAHGASEILLKYFGNLHSVSEKFQAGLVSEADRDSEDYIVKTLKTRFPTHSFLGEERGLNPASQSKPDSNAASTSQTSEGEALLWIIDPLDGTTNYIHRFPVFCVSIGLEVKGELVVAVIDAPKLGLRFEAVKGKGAFCNGQPIHVSDRKEFKDGLFATGFSGSDDTLEEQLALCSIIIRKARGIRRAGAAALDLCFVAQGIFDLFWEKHLQPWDTAAGTLIAREAGATITNLEGEPYHPRMKSILAGTPPMHAHVRTLLEEIRRSQRRS